MEAQPSNSLQVESGPSSALDVPQVPASEISRLAEHLFRHEAGKLVSVLTGIFGIERLQLAEDVVQEALVRAMQTWPYYGLPKNPAAWLTQTAKNLALDLIRREQLFRTKEPKIIVSLEQWSGDGAAEPGSEPLLDSEIKGDRLRLMFACCHPAIPQEAQAALALKTLCGFSPEEIAKAFLTSEAAIAKRLTRAKQRLREAQVPFEIPSGEELAPRLEGVLQTLYLLFNEGYKASSGEFLVRESLCQEAIRLTALLASQPAGNRPHIHALLALMLFNASRLAARSDAEGNLMLLEEQDRSKWDGEMIQQGMFHLAQSANGDQMTPYHLQAGIAACHCAAADWHSTDWKQILALYDHLLRSEPSPVVELNRAVAVAQVQGPAVALKLVQELAKQGHLDSYYLLYAVLGEFQMQLRQFPAAAGNFRKAIELTELKSERDLLSKKLLRCEESA